MGLVQLVIILIIIGAALWLLPRITVDTTIAAIAKVVGVVLALIAVLLFFVQVYETGEVPIR